MALVFDALKQHAERLRTSKIADLVQQAGRSKSFVLDVAGLRVDFTKHQMDMPALSAWGQWCDAVDLRSAIERLFTGSVLNPSEQQVVSHTAYRDVPSAVYAGSGVDVMPGVQLAKSRCEQMVAKVRRGDWSFPIRDIIHVGFGGSYLGPRFLMSACSAFHDASHQTHWHCSADTVALQGLLSRCDPRQTLIVLASKSFGTDELHTQWAVIKPWLQAVGDDWQQHVVAITSQAQRAMACGVLANHILPLCAGVGGRFSVWSSIAFVVMCAVGWSTFAAFCEGGRSMDHHFRTAPWTANVPVIAACLSMWYQRYFDVHQHCVVTYNQGLSGLSDYLQQLAMESLGKSHRTDGQAVDGHTVPAWFGGNATAGQHSYFQCLHQGTRVIPVDLICAVGSAVDEHHDLLSHCLAQGMALMQGHHEGSLDQQLPGNRPSTTILMHGITPANMGALLAMYEHQVFTTSVVWGINAFDQWGVAAGKRLYRAHQSSLRSGDRTAWDAGTQAAMAYALAHDEESEVAHGSIA